MRSHKTWKDVRGLSLIEVTIILLTLMVLSGVMAPMIMEFVVDARMVRVKEDCEAIGLSLARMLVDTGSCARLNGRLPCTDYNRVNLLVSEGNAIRVRGLGAETFNYASYLYEANFMRTTSRSVVDYTLRGLPHNINWINATHLGGATAFTSVIRTDADLRLTARLHTSDYRELLKKASIEYPESIISIISSAKQIEYKLQSCADINPPYSGVVKCTMNPGLRMLWMAYRPRTATNDRSVDLLRNIQWSGETLNAFMFKAETPKALYTFIVPEACGNLALLSVADRNVQTVYDLQMDKQIVAGTATIGWASIYGTDYTVDRLEYHLVENLPSGRIDNAYLYPDMFRLSYDNSMGMGWRGAYLSAVGPDPWGNRYLVNSIFFFSEIVRWPFNTICISAGPDGIIDTPFAAAGTKRIGDDFTYVISGRSR
jgi:hypothetical protein